jgi:hypothetical protein
MRTALDAWADLEAAINGRVVFGAAGVRDPEARCAEFAPVEQIDWLGRYVTAPGTGDCRSDGHYLCLGCQHLSGQSRFFHEDDVS